MTQRTDRIDELLREEMSAILQREVDDPRIGFATITDVETAPDLRHAKVLVSVIGQAEERRATLAAMGRAMPFVRHELGKRLRLKRIPEFHLELDDSVERGTRILHLLDELEAGRAPDDPAGPGETLPTPRPIVPAEPDSTEGLGAAAAELAARENARRRSRRVPLGRSVPTRRRR
jgi:ribosome-binding factor A